ncbi:MAG TPA: glycerol kinase GlpK [Blastocatellia bacterium]|jgi:glycerol kinase|nr:glycerol kinase GlpK [Blastocatellia bacterium]
MSRDYILALDQGTTSSRAILFDGEGRPAAIAQQEFEQLYPRPGWVEHRPDDIWYSQLAAAKRVLTESGVKADQVAAIGITNQRETTIIWNRETGEPIHNAIVWQCRRTADTCDRLRRDGMAPIFQQRTGLVLDAYFSGTKVRWLLDSVPGARELARAGKLAFGTVDTWLIWKLTGGRIHTTDPSNASRTLLYNIERGQWDDELLAALDVPREILPHVAPSSAVIGETDPALFGRAIPISGNAGDQQAALFGQVCTSPGMSKNTYGTGCFMLLNTGAERVRSKSNLLTTIAWKIGDEPVEYALEGSVFVAGAAVQWLRDGLRIIDTVAETEAMATGVEDNGGVYFVPAFVGLGAPHWDQYARGTIVGLTRGSSREHIVRAALESIAYQSSDVLCRMRDDSGIKLSELRVDGGAARNDFLMQFQADILGIPVVRPANTETTAAGAAYLAGLAVEFWADVKEINEMWQRERTFEPNMSESERKRLFGDWNRAVSRASNWIPAT